MDCQLWDTAPAMGDAICRAVTAPRDTRTGGPPDPARASRATGRPRACKSRGHDRAEQIQARDTSDDEPDERRDSERDTIELELEPVRAIEMATD
jgi:hypothetical protein